MDKFYQLTAAEWKKACLELKPAERDLLFYIKTLDPFNDGLDLILTEVAEIMNRNKGTISRALKVLVEKAWVEMELLQVRVKVRAKHHPKINQSPPNQGGGLSPDTKAVPQQSESLTTDGNKKKFKRGQGFQSVQTNAEPPNKKEFVSDKDVALKQPELRTDNLSCVQTTEVVYRQPELRTDNYPKPKPKCSKDCQPSKTYSDYLRLIKTLSDEQQRERFLNFCRRMADQLPNPVMMLDKWIYANFDFLKAQYIAQTGERIIKADSEQNTVNNAVQQTEENQTQREVNNRGTVTKKVKQSLPEKLVEYLKQAIANKKIKNFWYCEPLRRWMVLLNNSASMEIEVFLSKYPPEAMQS